VDEVLSVGDFEFQERCIGKMGDVSRAGRTVVVVSHSMGVVQTLCRKVVLLKQGEVDFVGPTSVGVRRYLEQRTFSAATSNVLDGPLAQRVRIESVSVNGQPLGETIALSPRSEVVIEMWGEASEDIRRCELVAGIERKGGIRVATVCDTLRPEALRKGRFCSEMVIPAFFLRPGDYVISVGGMSESLREWMWGEHLGYFTILEEWSEESRSNMDGLINVPFKGSREQ
jgi:lipopolysaccharide transport system ATP-binding protein